MESFGNGPSVSGRVRDWPKSHVLLGQALQYFLWGIRRSTSGRSLSSFPGGNVFQQLQAWRIGWLPGAEQPGRLTQLCLFRCQPLPPVPANCWAMALSMFSSKCKLWRIGRLPDAEQSGLLILLLCRCRPLPPLLATCWSKFSYFCSHGTTVPWHSRVANHFCDLPNWIVEESFS